MVPHTHDKSAFAWSLSHLLFFSPHWFSLLGFFKELYTHLSFIFLYFYDLNYLETNEQQWWWLLNATKIAWGLSRQNEMSTCSLSILQGCHMLTFCDSEHKFCLLRCLGGDSVGILCHVLLLFKCLFLASLIPLHFTPFRLSSWRSQSYFALPCLTFPTLILRLAFSSLMW